AQLIAELSGGRIARGMIDVYPTPHAEPRVRLRMSRVRRILGIAPPAATAASILNGLGLPAAAKGEELDVQVPSFRRDITMEDDLAEEVIRVWGYDRIPSTLPGGAITSVQIPATRRQDRLVRAALVGAGLAEAVTYSFTDAPRAAALPGLDAAAAIPLVNPMSEEASQLRQHPLEGLLGAIATNIRRRQPDVRMFEIAVTYSWAGPETAPHPPRGVPADRAAHAIERRWLTVALTGTRGDTAWYADTTPVDVYDAKGFAEHALGALGVRARARDGGRLAGFEADSHGVFVTEGGEAVGEFGEVAAGARGAFDIDAPVFAAALDLDAILALPRPGFRHEALPRFPAVQRDMAFVLGAEQTRPAAEVEGALRAEAGPLLRDLTLFDVFRFPDGRRSLAWRLTFQAADRTLTDDEVNTIHARVAARITERFGLSLRA
ncbi:MAG TPA: hypothetical protein VEA38_24735, partial [Terriglobales bacterium]|nr:hypothetical protein [Terriglobales bacterium]